MRADFYVIFIIKSNESILPVADRGFEPVDDQFLSRF